MRVVGMLALALALPALAPKQKASPWRTATASAGFQIDYPTPWQTRPTFGWDGVMLANFPRSAGQEGVLIPRGAGTISAYPTPSAGGSLTEIAHRQTRGDAHVVIRAVRLRPAHAGGCTIGIESESMSEVGPGAYQQVTGYYCKVSGKPIAVVLVNWRGDPRLAEYRRTLLQVTESLRPTVPSQRR